MATPRINAHLRYLFDTALFVALVSLALWPALGGERQVIVAIAGAALLLSVPTSTTAIGMRAGIAAGVLCLYAGLATAWFVWPLYLLVPCGAAFLFGRNRGKRHITLVRLGRLGWSEFGAILIIALVSGTALVAWVELLRPDLSGFIAMLPHWPTVLLLLLGVGFSIVNAVLEELLWRGFLQSWLLSVVNPAVAIGVQAVSFGTFHFTGFPGGLVGIALATVYGLMLGGLAFRCRGLLAPCAVHILADSVIFAIVLGHSRT